MDKDPSELSDEQLGQAAGGNFDLYLSLGQPIGVAERVTLLPVGAAVRAAAWRTTRI